MIDAVTELLALISAAATFQPSVSALLLNPHLQKLALVVPFLAGISEMTGQSAVLVLNRVSRIRFIASLIVTGFVYLLTAIVWTFLTLLIASLFATDDVSAMLMGAVISISFAPRILGVLTIAPYYGEFLGRLLDGWMIAIAAYGIHAAAGITGPAAALSSVAGWAIWVLFRNASDSQLRPVLRRFEALVAGRPLLLTYANVDDVIRKRLELDERRTDGDG